MYKNLTSYCLTGFVTRFIVRFLYESYRIKIMSLMSLMNSLFVGFFYELRKESKTNFMIDL